MGQFPEVDPNLDLPALDARTLELWRDRKVFQRSLDQRAGAEPFVFYEGPPTANGRPGVHHVEARVFKDLFPRFKTMRGYRVDRKGGWDCHGLPVELEVEKELGLKDKQAIETYGVEAFNARCRESVERYVDAFEQLTERIGFWIDTSQAYRTMDTSYVESVWWALAELHRRGLLVEDYKVSPYCPRCQTTLSDAEVAMGYQEVEDLTAYVALPATTGTLAEEGAALLVWTTQPWTLVPNVSVVVGPGIDYVLVEATGDDGEARKLVVARERVAAAVGEDARVLRPVPLEELLGTRYQRAFDLIPVTDEEAARGWTVVADEYVTTSDGSGLVQTSPAYGAEDLAVGQRYDTPVLHPVGLDGKFGPETGWLAGRFVKEADADLVEDLRRRGLLWRAEPHRHAYPFCWRCGTPLIYYALTSWYARTTAVKDRLLAENARIGWRPEHIRDGRFGDWLANNVDWALSRARYWGTPAAAVALPGRARDRGREPGRPVGQGRPRPVRPRPAPAVRGRGRLRLPGLREGGPPGPRRARRLVRLGVDAVRPVGLPAHPGQPGRLRAGLPGRLHLRGHRPDPRLVLLAAGREHPAVRPDLLPQRGLPRPHRRPRRPQDVQEPRQRARPVRAAGPLRGRPAALVHAGHRVAVGVAAAVPRGRRGRHPVVFLTLWNTYSFFCLYARLEGSTRPGAAGRAATTPLDRWVLAELADTVDQVTRDLDDYDATSAARRLAAFVDDLSNWYVRLSRRRFWRGTGEDADAAFRTLWTCLRTVTCCWPPTRRSRPRSCGRGWWSRSTPSAPDSVHLVDWPEPDRAAPDPG